MGFSGGFFFPSFSSSAADSLGGGGPSLKLIGEMGRPRNSATRVRIASATRCHLQDFLQLSHCTRLPVNAHTHTHMHACTSVRCKFSLTPLHQQFSTNTPEHRVARATTQYGIFRSFLFLSYRNTNYQFGKAFLLTTLR